jgi:TolA-binding protein
VTRDFDQAQIVFKGLVDKFPNSGKTPDALLKLGYSQFEKKRYSEARTSLRDVQNRYPGSDAAKLAAEKLEKFPASAR